MKKKLTIILTILLAVFTFWGCSGKETDGETIIFSKDASYALGLVYGADIRSNIDSGELVPDYDEFLKGFIAGIYDKKSRFNIDEAMNVVEAVFSSIYEQRIAKMEQDEISFLAGNARKPGVTITPSGLQYEVIKEGTGQKPSSNSIVLVHYEGTYIDGSVFDSSRKREAPLELNLSERIISGWKEGLQLMNAGSHYILYIPSELGYGPDGIINPSTGTHIMPPYATLIFDIELLEIIN